MKDKRFIKFPKKPDALLKMIKSAAHFVIIKMINGHHEHEVKKGRTNINIISI